MKPRRLATILALVLPSFMYGVYRFSVGFLVPGLESVYAINDATAGVVVSASVGFVGLGVIGSGYLAQRFGDVKAILAGFLIFSVPMGVTTVANSLPVFSGLFLVASFGSGLMITPSYGLASALIPQRKGFAVSFVTSGYNFAGFVGPSATGYLLTAYGWGAPFAAFAVLGIAFFFVFLAALGRGVRSASTSPLSTFAELLRTKVIRVLAVAAFFADLGFLVYLSWAPKFLLSSFASGGASATTIDTIFGVGLGLGGIGTLAGGALFDRFGGRKSATLAGVLPAIVLFGVFVANSFVLAVVFVLLTGLFANMFWSLITAMCQVSVPEERRTAATSVVQTAGFVGALLGPGIAGVIGGPVPPVLILTSAAPYVVLAVVVASLYRDPKPSTPPRT
jgi:MFS transporter, DHA1 family, inner membrane transport protein